MTRSTALRNRTLSDSEQIFSELQTDTKSFLILSQLLKKWTGIHLPPNPKNYSLMASRLSSVLKKHGFSDYQSYIQLLHDSNDEDVTEFMTSMTTNTTHFFRESRHFDILKTELAPILKRKENLHQKELRIWCAAASSGQEAYTIAMSILENFPQLAQWSIKFLATDIDTNVLQHACRGIYTDHEIESIPPLFRQKYFTAVPDTRTDALSDRKFYRTKENLTQMIRFAPFNLLNENYTFQFQFDIIFCRNVLIYFDTETSQKVVEKLIHCLNPGGLLFLGHSESGAMKSTFATQVSAAAYKKNANSGGKK